MAMRNESTDVSWPSGIRWTAYLAAMAVVVIVAGCSGSDDDDGGGAGGGESFEAFSEDCTITTGPGTSTVETTNNLLNAFAEASSGDVICMVDGEYSVSQGLSIGVSNIEIRGESQSGTVLDFSAQTEGGNGILAQVAEGFTARQFTVKNTASDAIKAKGTDGVEMIDLTVTWEGGPDTENGAYGLYPVESSNVLVEGCTVSYASDAGVYLGQSDTAILRDNETFGNVVGLEIENTVRASAYNNYTHDNSNGILVIDLPDLMVTNGEKNIVRDNRVVNNNEPNFGKPGTAVSKMPAGSGILMVSVDQTEVFDNEVHGNESVGIGIATYLWVEPSAGSGDDYDPYPEGNWIHDNTVYNNGGDPKGAAVLLTGSADDLPNLFWDGTYDTSKDTSDTSLRNCFRANEDDQGNGLSAGLVSDSDSPCEPSSGDAPAICDMDCEHSSLSPVEL